MNLWKILKIIIIGLQNAFENPSKFLFYLLVYLNFSAWFTFSTLLWPSKSTMTMEVMSRGVLLLAISRINVYLCLKLTEVFIIVIIRRTSTRISSIFLFVQAPKMLGMKSKADMHRKNFYPHRDIHLDANAVFVHSIFSSAIRPHEGSESGLWPPSLGHHRP